MNGNLSKKKKKELNVLFKKKSWERKKQNVTDAGGQFQLRLTVRKFRGAKSMTRAVFQRRKIVKLH